MPNDWRLASCDSVSAFRAGTRLGLLASWTVPGNHHRARIRVLHDSTRPTRYAVEWAEVPNDEEEPAPAPLLVAGVFLSRRSTDVIRVATADRDLEVTVMEVDDPSFDRLLSLG
jgi:hypothetical protein